MEHERGQVDTSAAEIYDELFVPALFGRFSSDVAATAGVRSAEDVLDVACGTGALTRTLEALNPFLEAMVARVSGKLEKS